MLLIVLLSYVYVSIYAPLIRGQVQCEDRPRLCREIGWMCQTLEFHTGDRALFPVYN